MNHEQQHQTEEEKMEVMWLDLVRSQTDYCLRLMVHVQTSRSASELDKVNVLSYLGRVMEDVRKGYDGFREICTNIRQAPFTVPPGFAKISYKFTDIQLRDYQARKNRQQLDETNAEWLSYLEGEIPKRKERTKSHKQVNEELEEKKDPQSKKRKRSVKSVVQASSGNNMLSGSIFPYSPLQNPCHNPCHFVPPSFPSIPCLIPPCHQI